MNVKGVPGITRIESARGSSTSAARDVAGNAPRETGGSDQITLTTAVQHLAKATGAEGNGPPIDRPRVEAIRTMIQSGGYYVDAERIADRLLRLERELGG